MFYDSVCMTFWKSNSVKMESSDCFAGAWIEKGLDYKELAWVGNCKDGGGIGREDHFLPHKFLKRTFQR